MQLIPQWRSFWRRWSTWLLGASSFLSAGMAFMPTIQELIDPELYRQIMLALAVSTFLVIQIKQNSIPEPKK